MTAHPSPPKAYVPARSLRFIAAFIVTALLFALGQFHRSSGSVLSSVITEQFDLRPEQIGFVIGIMFIAQAVGQIPSGVLIDRYGTRRALAGMGLLASLGCLLVASANDWILLMVGRALIGFGFSAAMMGSFKLFAAWVPPCRTTTLTGRYMFFGLLGGLLATTPLTLLLDNLGWQSVFLLFAAGTAVMACLIAVVVRDAPPQAINGPSDPPETLIQVIRGLATVFRKRELWPMLLAAPLLYTPSQMLLGLWAMPYLADVHGLPTLLRSYCLITMVVGMSLGPLVYGFLDRRSKLRWRIVTFGALVVASAFLALALLGEDHWLIATALSALICGSSTFFLLIISRAQAMFRPSQAGRVVSTIGVISLAGVFVTQSGSAIILGFFPSEGATASALGYRVLFGLMALASGLVAYLSTRMREAG